MEKKIAQLGAITLPIVRTLKQSHAASIGRMIVRYAYLEFLMGKTIYRLLEISPKQGRLAIRLPQSKTYPGVVRDLLEFHRIKIDLKYEEWGKKIDGAERARNLLAHSIYLDAGQGKVHVQHTRGRWYFGQEFERHSRALTPASYLLNRKFFREKSTDIETAIKATYSHGALISAALDALNEKRNKQKGLDRRHHPQTENTPPAPPQPSPA